MVNNRGSAVALVLMILAVVSLIGVGLISLSRVDVKLTAALKGYDKVFGLADGACTRAFYYMSSMGNQEEKLTFLGTGVAGTQNRLPDIYTGTEPQAGTYSASLVLEGYTTKPQPGWSTEYYPEYWIGEGTATRLTGALTIEASAVNMKSKH